MTEAPTIPQLTDEQRQHLLQIQFLTAINGSEALMIHLGKAYLNQVDRQHHTVEAIPYNDKNYEQLLDMLEERQLAIPGEQDDKLVSDLGMAMVVPKALPAPAPVLEAPVKQPKKRRKRPAK